MTTDNEYNRMVLREIRKATLDPDNPYSIVQQVSADINFCTDTPEFFTWFNAGCIY